MPDWPTSVFSRAAADPDEVMLRRRAADGRWQDVTAAQFCSEVSGAREGPDRRRDRARRPGSAHVADQVRVDARRLRDLGRRGSDRAGLRDLIRRAGGVDRQRLGRHGRHRRDRRARGDHRRPPGPAARPRRRSGGSPAWPSWPRPAPTSPMTSCASTAPAGRRATWPRSSTPRAPPGGPRAAS